MRKFIPVLNSKGLLAASIAMLSGHALAETAGRVSFVSGDVTAKATDGSTRTLKRGDSINGGDRITTNAGRVQLRFTDGGFVALQPGTVFGVDEYVYANRKPEETSLFFSLIQGGMRTISGAIGKMNKKTYQVRTPVATIGIRGTEYRAVVSERGLIVSVGSGFVNVANGNGDITGGAGQNILVRGLGAGPELGKEEALILASGVDGDQGQVPEAQDAADDGSVALADIQEISGDYTFLFTRQARAALPNSSPANGGPTYLLASPHSAVGTEYFGVFDQTGAATGTVGGLIDLYGYGISSSGFANYFRIGDMQLVNSGTIGALSWGEFTNGTSSTNQIFDCIDGCAPITLTDADYLPYVVGTAPNGNLGKGTATYTLQGATPVRDSLGNAGTLDNFEIRVNLDFASVEAKFELSMPVQTNPASPDIDYLVSTAAPVSLYNLGTSSTFSLNSSMLTVTDSTGACAVSAGGCSAWINAFFAGDASSQVGASYGVTDSLNALSVSGVAALGLSGYNSATVLDSGPGYTLAYAGPTGYAVLGGYTAFDTSTYTQLDTSLTNTFDANGTLVSATASDGLGNTLTLMDRGGATGIEGGQAGGLKWGRWYNSGTAAIPVVSNGLPGTLAPGESLAYLTGPMTQPDIFGGIVAGYGQGTTATYTFQGGTTAIGNDGTSGTVRAGSKLDASFYTSTSAWAQLAMDMNVDMKNGDNYHLTGSTSSLPGTSGATFSFIAGNSSSCAGGAAAGSTSGCSANVQGFFAGQQAQQIGLSYQIDDLSGRKVTGAAAFGRGSFVPATVLP